MSKNISNNVGNTPGIDTLTRQLLSQFNSCALLADEKSTIFGDKTMFIFDNSNKYFLEAPDIIITQNIESTNELLTQLYSLMKNMNTHGDTIQINKINSSNNGERSFDIQVFSNMMMNGENKLVVFYINLTQGSDKTKRKEKKVNKVINRAKELEKKKQDLLADIEIGKLVESTEQLKIVNDEFDSISKSVNMAQHNLEKAIQSKIESFWVRKFQIMFLC